MPTPSCTALRAGAAAVAAAMLLSSGCATPGQSVQQALSVETPGCPQAQCSLSNDRGRWTVTGTPASVTVSTSHEPLRVVCQGPGSVQAEAGAGSSLPPTGPGGAVIGGAVGTGVGLAAAAPALAFIPPLGVIIVAMGAAVGAGTGAAIESQRRAILYPERITVPMNCGAPAATSPGSPRAALGFGVRGLSAPERQGAPAGEADALLVTEVTPGGAADRAGLRAGDLLLAADGLPPADAGALQARVLALAVGQRLPLRIRRGGQTLDVVLVQPAPPP